MQLLISILAIVGGFVLLVWGADRFVHGAAATARNLGVSTLVIGLTIVGFGTSAPELLVSAMAAMSHNSGLAVGNAIGSNITNVGLVIGVTAIISPLVVNSGTLRREFPLLFVVMLLTLALLLDHRLGRIDGIILLSSLGVLIFWMVRLGMGGERKEPMTTEYEQEIPKVSLGKALLWTAIGLGVLLISSRILVYGAVNIAHMLGVSDLIIGLTIVAIGTSLPELAASIMSALKNEPDIALGNVIGSNMFNLLGVLGLPGAISPLDIDPEVLTRDYSFMIALTIAMFFFAYGFKKPGQINRLEGGILLGIYVAYMVVLYFSVHTHSG
ncbi:MAG: calcium/sodium antiporter [Gammaproteobacteria bacterium]|nr:calcium/sodium antiporter [Gammaproteobacteria bacterium]